MRRRRRGRRREAKPKQCTARSVKLHPDGLDRYVRPHWDAGQRSLPICREVPAPRISAAVVTSWSHSEVSVSPPSSSPFSLVFSSIRKLNHLLSVFTSCLFRIIRPSISIIQISWFSTKSHPQISFSASFLKLTPLKELRGDAKRKNRNSHRLFRANIKSYTLLCSFFLKELPSRMCRLSSNSKVPLLFCPLLFSWFPLSVLLKGIYPKFPSFISVSGCPGRQTAGRSGISLSAASSFCVKIWASDLRHNSSSTTQTSDPRPHFLLLLLVCFSFSLFLFF